jgi:hypothetical protein
MQSAMDGLKEVAETALCKHNPCHTQIRFKYTCKCYWSVHCDKRVCLFVCLFVCFWRNSPQRARTSSLTKFLDHTQRRTTVGRTPLDEWSTCRRDQTTHNTHNRETFVTPVGFKPTILADKRPQTHALDCTATGTGQAYKSTFFFFR